MTDFGLQNFHFFVFLGVKVDILFKMINIPLDVIKEEEREPLFRNCPNRRVRGELATKMSRSVNIRLPDLDMSTRNSYLTTPRRIEITIDCESMQIITLENGQQGKIELLPIMPLLRAQRYDSYLDIDSWMPPRNFRDNMFNMCTEYTIRNLGHTEVDETGRPLETAQEVFDRIDNQRQYVSRFMDFQRRDRIPYHTLGFQLLGPPIHGESAPPNLRRVPSNESLKRLLPDSVQRELERTPQPAPQARDPSTLLTATDVPFATAPIGPNGHHPITIGRAQQIEKQWEEAAKDERLLIEYRERNEELHRLQREHAKWVHHKIWKKKYLYADLRNEYETITLEVMDRFDNNPNEKNRPPTPVATRAPTPVVRPLSDDSSPAEGTPESENTDLNTRT